MRNVLRKSLVTVVTLTLVSTLFLFLNSAAAAEVSLEGIVNGATYNRLEDRPVTITIDAVETEDQSFTRVDLRLQSSNAPFFGLAPSVASIYADGGVIVGSPGKPFIRSDASCMFEQTNNFGYGYGYGYGPGGSFGYGYGAGGGFGYGYGYEHSPLRIVCNVELALAYDGSTPTAFDLGALQANFQLTACILKTSTPSGNPGECSPGLSFTVYDEYPLASITPLAQSGLANGFTANFQLQASDPDRSIMESTWTFDYGDRTAGAPPLAVRDGDEFVTSGGGGPVPATVLESHVYADKTRTYTAYLNVTDKDGATTVEKVTVGLAPAIRLLPIHTRDDAPHTVNWQLSIDDKDAPPGGWDIQHWTLNFGDGDSIEGTGADLGPLHQIVVPHTYAVAGTYTATASAEDIMGAVGEDSSQAIVDFSEKCLPTVKFTSLDGGPVTRYNPAAQFTGGIQVASTIEVVHQGLQCGFVNNKPLLEGAWVDKTHGGTLDTFTFRVTYFDFDGQAPQYVRVSIDDGAPITLAPDVPPGTNPATGLRFASAPIGGQSPGPHKVTFTASDGALPAVPKELNPGFTVLNDVITATVQLGNPTNRLVLNTLQANAPAELLPPLSLIGINSVDSHAESLPDGIGGRTFNLVDVGAANANDWDLCFYAAEPDIPGTIRPILPCFANPGPETGQIPVNAKWVNVWRDSLDVVPDSFRLSWGVRTFATAPTVPIPANTGAGVLRVWLDKDGDNLLDGTETDLVQPITGLPQQITPVTRDVTLPTQPDGRYRYVASFTVPTDPALVQGATTSAVVIQRFVNDQPHVQLTPSTNRALVGVPVTFTLSINDADDTQGATAARLGGIRSWTLAFGDGNSVSSPPGPVPTTLTRTHTYTALGTHTVRLDIEDRAGVDKFATRVVNVRANNAPPENTGNPNPFTQEPVSSQPPADTTPIAPTSPSPAATTPPATFTPPATTTPATTPATTTPATTPTTPTTSTPAATTTPTTAPPGSNFFAVNVQASAQADGTIRVTWQAPTDAAGQISGWLIWRASSPFTLVARVDDPNQRTFTDDTVEPGKRYNYVVTLILATGEGVVDTLEQVKGFVNETALPSSGYQSATVAGRGLSTGAPSAGFLPTVMMIIAVLVVAALVAVLLAVRSGPQTTTVIMPNGAQRVEPRVVPQDGAARVIERVNEQGASEAFLLLHCTRCNTNFETLYSEERPLIRNCGNCGRLGILPPLRESVGPPRGPSLATLGGPDADEISRLQAWGITTSEQLRRANVEELSSLTHIEPGRLHDWQARAELVRLKGISAEAADLLVRAGIRGAGELGSMEPRAVVERITANVPDAKAEKGRAQRWIESARDNQLDKWAEPA